MICGGPLEARVTRAIFFSRGPATLQIILDRVAGAREAAIRAMILSSGMRSSKPEFCRWKLSSGNLYTFIRVNHAGTGIEPEALRFRCCALTN